MRNGLLIFTETRLITVTGCDRSGCAPIVRLYFCAPTLIPVPSAPRWKVSDWEKERDEYFAPITAALFEKHKEVLDGFGDLMKKLSDFGYERGRAECIDPAYNLMQQIAALEAKLKIAVEALDRVDKGLRLGISTVPNSFCDDQIQRALALIRAKST